MYVQSSTVETKSSISFRFFLKSLLIKYGCKNEVSNHELIEPIIFCLIASGSSLLLVIIFRLNDANVRLLRVVQIKGSQH